MQRSNGHSQDSYPAVYGNGLVNSEEKDKNRGPGNGSSALSVQDRDIVRLVGQYLHSLGLEKTAEQLVQESGCNLEHPVAATFRAHVLNGEWEEAEGDLEQLASIVSHSNTHEVMRFLLLEQKFLELVEDKSYVNAIACLQNELTPLQDTTFPGRAHQLSCFLMHGTREELCKAAGWKGKGLESRHALMERLQGLLPVTVVLPPRRLQTLLQQAVEFQLQRCSYHNGGVGCSSGSACANTGCTLSCSPSKSLLTDHSCSRDNFPCSTTQTLTDHTDEVWFCRFSPDGTKLATGCKDGVVIVWAVSEDTGQVTLKHTLEGHTYGVAFIAWSPDSACLIVCGPDECADLWLWNALTGELKFKMTQSAEDSLTSAAFQAGGQKFVTGGTHGQFYQCDLDGRVLDSWESVRVQCLACLNDGRTAVAADTHYRLRTYDFEALTDTLLIQEDHPIMSFTLSDDGRYALLNVATQGLHIWDIKDKVMVRKLQGLRQGFYTIHSAFGGVDQKYVASGSEDNHVYIWHTRDEMPLMTLEGHSSTVNCVHWNPRNPTMIASVSDDCTVRIWGPKNRSPIRINNQLSRNGSGSPAAADDGH